MYVEISLGKVAGNTERKTKTKAERGGSDFKANSQLEPRTEP